MVLLTSWRLLRRCTSAMEAEAEACLEGVRLTAEWVQQQTVVESDCSQLIDGLRSAAPTRASWVGILKDIWAVGALLPEIAFSKIKRDANMIAHNLAQPVRAEILSM